MSSPEPLGLGWQYLVPGNDVPSGAETHSNECAQPARHSASLEKEAREDELC